MATPVETMTSYQHSELNTRVTDAYIRVKWATNNLIIRWIKRQIVRFYVKLKKDKLQ